IVEQLLGIVRQIHDDGCTIILVEQSVNIALTIATRAYFMEKGEVRFSGPTAELLERGDILRSVFLEGAGSMKGAPRKAVAKTNGAPAKTAPAGHDHEGNRLPPILEVQGLTKRFGGISAVSDVAFELAPGEII